MGEPTGTDLLSSISLLYIIRNSVQRIALLAACFHAGFLLPEDGGDMFLRHVGWLSTDYTALYIPEDITLHNHRCENLKSCRQSISSRCVPIWKKQ
jgi:hypothetical protein